MPENENISNKLDYKKIYNSQWPQTATKVSLENETKEIINKILKEKDKGEKGE